MEERILVQSDVTLGHLHVELVQKRLLEGKLEVWPLLAAASAVVEPGPNLGDWNVDHRSLLSDDLAGVVNLQRKSYEVNGCTKGGC